MNFKKLFVLMSLVCGAASAQASLPEGNYRTPHDGAIYYSNGRGHVCWHPSWEDFVRSGGREGAWTEIYELPYDVAYDGPCTYGRERPRPYPGRRLGVGTYRTSHDGAIYYSNGQGHVCWFPTMEAFRRAGYRDGQWTDIPALPYRTVYDGVCRGY